MISTVIHDEVYVIVCQTAVAVCADFDMHIIGMTAKSTLIFRLRHSVPGGGNEGLPLLRSSEVISTFIRTATGNRFLVNILSNPKHPAVHPDAYEY